MKILYFTDSHIRGSSPINRLDNFYDSIKKKFIEIGDISKQENIDYILHGGDWFDRPDVSPSVVGDFAKIIESFQGEIYSIAGNHDVYGHNPDTIKRTMLGLLDRIGIINLIEPDNGVILEKNGLKVHLTGSSYRYDIDCEDFRYYCLSSRKNDVNYTLNMVHGMLLDKPFYEGIKYTLIDDILETKADITLAGHYHSGFGVKYLGGKYFINPGSIVRISNTLAEIERRPKIVIIDLNDKITIKEVYLKSALNGKDILDRTKIEISKDRAFKLNEFYSSLSKENVYDKIDINKIIDDIVTSQNVSNEVKEESIRRISLAEENMEGSEVEEY